MLLSLFMAFFVIIIIVKNLTVLSDLKIQRNEASISFHWREFDEWPLQVTFCSILFHSVWLMTFIFYILQVLIWLVRDWNRT